MNNLKSRMLRPKAWPLQIPSRAGELHGILERFRQDIYAMLCVCATIDWDELDADDIAETGEVLDELRWVWLRDRPGDLLRDGLGRFHDDIGALLGWGGIARVDADQIRQAAGALRQMADELEGSNGAQPRSYGRFGVSIPPRPADDEAEDG